MAADFLKNKIYSFKKGDFMKLCINIVLVVALLLNVPVVVGMMHEVDPTEFIGHNQHTFDQDPTSGKGNNDSAIIDAASSTHEDQSQIDQPELLQLTDESGESLVGVGDALPASMPVSADVATVDQPLDPFDEISLDDEPAAPGNQIAPKTKVQKFVDAVKKLWNDFWNKLTGRKPQVVASGAVETVASRVADVQPLTVDQKTQLRSLALQDPSNFAAVTAQTIAEKVGQAAKELRDAKMSTDPKAYQEALSYVEATYEPLQLAAKTLNDLSSYVSDPKKFDLVKQQNVETQYLSEHTFFPADSAGQRDLYTQLGKEVLQPRDGVYGANSNASELAYAYRRNQGQQMLTDNPSWQTALKLTQGSALGVDAQGNVVVRSASGKEQPLTDAQYASLGQAYAQELPDASLNQEQLLHLARAKMAASDTPADVKAALQEFVQCVRNDFYYGDLVTFQKTGQKLAGNSSLRAPNPSDLRKVATARQSLETDYQQAKSAVAGA